MDYTVLGIRGSVDKLQTLHEKFTSKGHNSFKYSAIVNEPAWLKLVPWENISLIDNPSNEEARFLDNLVMDVRQSATLRTWFLEYIAGIDRLRQDPWKHNRRPQLDITHTIFNCPLFDLPEKVGKQLQLRPHLSIRDIFGENIGEVIEAYFCLKLYQMTDCRSQQEWKERHVGTSIEGIIVETDLSFEGDGHLGYCIQTPGGTPWAFFRLLSQQFPELRISVSDVDVQRSIIQMKFYRYGKIVGTMTTEDPSVLSEYQMHAKTLFSGVYHYLPLT